MAKRSKYGNTRVFYDGRWFDSKREQKRYVELCLLEKAGEIRDLKCQVPFELHALGPERGWFECWDDIEQGLELVGRWIADFTYEEKAAYGRWDDVVEDCKGPRPALYKWKKKHVEIEHGIKIRET